MTISSSSLLSTHYSFNQLSSTSSTDATQQVPPPPQDDSSSSDKDSTSISNGAEQMYNLQSLASSDPDKFKSVTGKIASELSEKASSETDSQKAKFLSDMASRFSAASESGSADSLRPQRPSSTSSGSQTQGYPHGSHSGHRPDGAAFQEVSSIISDAMSSSDVTSTTSTTA